MKETLQQMIDHLFESVIRQSPRIAAALMIFIAFYCAGVLMKFFIKRLQKRTDSDRARILGLVAGLVKFSLTIIGIITSLGTFGVNVTAMVAGLGLSGFALGFALKDALSNLLAGVLILFYHPFRAGDKIKVTGCEGEVIDINLRYTIVKGEEETFLIPNATCFNNWIGVKKKED